MIIPAILEKDWKQIEEKLKICQDFANTVHVDFIDGKFVNNLTFLDPSPFKEYSNYFKLEAHLMVEEPINYLEPLFEAGFKRFIGHVERMSDQVEFIARGQSFGEIGLGLDLPTEVSKIKVPLDDLDQILLMSVPAGLSGQSFNTAVLQKIESLSSQNFTNIEVDGGINDQTILQAKNAGASRFCVTSFLFNSPKPGEKFRLLESLVS